MLVFGNAATPIVPPNSNKHGPNASKPEDYYWMSARPGASGEARERLANLALCAAHSLTEVFLSSAAYAM